MALTRRQSGDLHEAVLQYLLSKGDAFEGCAVEFAAAAGLEVDSVSRAGIVPTLVRKWTASVKLQKKVLDLEAQVHALQGELRAAQAAARGTVATPGSALSAEWLPCSPAACCTAGHSDGVSVLVCHPVFDVVVSGGLDALLHVWAVQEDGLVRERTLRGHTGGLRAAAFDAAGQRLATAAQDDSVKLWSFSPGAGSQAFRTLAGEGVGCVAWVPASDHLVGGARDGTCRMWNAATGSCIQTWSTLEGPVRSLAVSPDAAALAVGGDAGVVQVWSLVSGAAQESSCSLELVAHEHAVESIEFAGVAQAARLRRKSAQAAALQGVKAQLSFGEEGAPRAAAAGGGEDLSTGPDPAAYILTAGRDNRVAVHDAETGVQVCSCEAHAAWAKQATWHPCGLLVVSVGEDKALACTDVLQGKTVRVLSSVAASFPTAVAVCAGASSIVTGDSEGKLSLWMASPQD